MIKYKNKLTHKLQFQDLKPNNICIDENDGNFRAKVNNFLM